MMKQTIVIENKSLYRTLASVALPIAFQSLIASSLSLIDNLMVGSLGEIELAAVGLSVQIYFIHWMVMFGFTSGSSTFMSQFWGNQDLFNIRKVTGFAITVCFTVSFIIFFVPAVFFPETILRIFTDIDEPIKLGVEYIRTAAICFLAISITVPFTAALRATQQTSIPLKISILVFTTNTVLNYIFIFGKFGAPELGVKGAALATAISRCLELLIMILVVFVGKNKIAGKLNEFFGWSKILMFKIVSNAVPTTLNETMWGIGMATYNAAYGRVGITEFAAIQASSTINNLFVMAIFSLGDAILILVGQRLGRGELEYAVALSKKLLKISVVIGVIAGIALILSSKFIIQLFKFTKEGQQFTFLILLIYGLFMALKLFNGIMITGTLRSGGDTKYAMLAETGCVWLIGVPLVFFGALYLKLPIYFVVLMSQTEEIAKFITLYRRFVSLKWVKNVIFDI
ncbi:MATE family efflux transporter [Anaerovorax odorimutans]|uniref:MATE family efflux transporter n=1 Tax=Anaerovorax odorimutans TaxID=109327 RepID=UPI000416C7C3|nr:MATE family efflux transporter [Anaerovorax odorimutans]